METYPISLALLDFVPTFFFLTGAFFLARTVSICLGTPAARSFAVGAGLVFLGGFLKACWKLLYSTQLADIRWMSDAQFIFLGIGFSIIFVIVFQMLGKSKASLAAAMPLLGMASWKMPFLFLLVAASLGAEGILAYLAFRRNLRLAAAGFIMGILGILLMGAFSGAEQSVSMQWTAETVNTLGQGGFMLGCLLFHRDVNARGCSAKSR